MYIFNENVMNKNAPLYGFIISIVIIIVVYFSYRMFIKNDNEFLLDNPTDQPIEVILNQENYVLAPRQSVVIVLNEGKNYISSTSLKKVILKDTFFIANPKKDVRGVVNPTHSTYYSFKKYYGALAKVDSLYKAHSSMIDNKLYYGDIKEYHNLYINEFYSNINQDFPKIIKKVDSIETRTKLFRKSQFLEFYQTDFQ